MLLSYTVYNSNMGRDASIIRTRSSYTVYSYHRWIHGVCNCVNRRPLLEFRTHSVNRTRIARRVYRSGRVNLPAFHASTRAVVASRLELEQCLNCLFDYEGYDLSRA